MSAEVRNSGRRKHTDRVSTQLHRIAQHVFLKMVQADKWYPSCHSSLGIQSPKPSPSETPGEVVSRRASALIGERLRGKAGQFKVEDLGFAL